MRDIHFTGRDQVPGNLDALTGLMKRDSFSRQLSELVSADSGDTRIFSLAVIDIDHFKSINDGFGHSRGDEILTEFGERARKVTREEDLLFRYGGDEFTVLLPGADKKEAGIFAKRLLETCSMNVFQGNPPLSLTLSIGVAQFPEDGLTARELFDAADRRLYAAKRFGRNRVVLHDDPAGERMDTALNDGRLLGREKELASFMAFAQESAEKGRGFFMVLGPDGSGKSCFLEAAASYLSLGDYRLLKVTGSGETNSPLSALSGALECTADPEMVRQALHRFPGSSMSIGVFLMDIHAMDRASIQMLSEFYDEFSGWMIIAASTERSAAVEGGGFGGVTASVRLGSITLEDCRAWFRAVMMWNPPDEFLEWFHSETGGLPGLFIQGMNHLERRGFIVRRNGSFSVEEDYREFPLGSRMEFGSAAEINNLPVDLTLFLGRESELERIRVLINDGCRLITLRGMSGMGSRRLAIRAAGRNEFMFPAGICMVDCSPGDIPVPVRLASRLSLPSGRNATDTIISFIENSRLLLLLIDADTDLSPFVSELLGSCPGITIIATSRSVLEIPQEVVVAVEGVSTFKPDSETPSDAASIFIQTAERLAGLKFPEEMKLSIIEEICRLLGGAPLAIEMAASWTRVMSLAAICRRIRANPSFLGGSSDSSGSEGLSDIFQQSWDHLSAMDKNALARLTVFAGHFTVEEAEEISDISPDLVLSLVDRSFLLRDDMGIHIPAMTRDFIIQENSPFSRGLEVAREMHCRYFASRTAFLGEMIRTGHEAARGLDGIRSSFEDISLAWKLAVEKKRFRFLRQMLRPLTLYCNDRGRFRTGFNMMEEALQGAGDLMSPGLAALTLASQAILAFRIGRANLYDKLIASALNRSGDLSDIDRGRVLLTCGMILVEKGALTGASDHLNKALEIFRKNQQTEDILEAELTLVQYNLQCGNYAEVRKVLPPLAERCRAEGYRIGEWRTKLYMGNLAASEGDNRRARESFLGYLSAVKTAGYTGKVAMALNQIAGIEASQGDYDQAEQHYSRASDYFKRIGSVRGQAGIKMNMAVLKQMTGLDKDVQKNYSEALVLGEKVHDESVIAGSLSGLAFHHLKNGDADRAELFLVRAAETASRSGNNPVLLRVIYGFAELDYLKGLTARAASTAIALLHSPSGDAESHSFCMELLQKIRREKGSEFVGKEKDSAAELSLQELLAIYTRDRTPGLDSVYRKG